MSAWFQSANNTMDTSSSEKPDKNKKEDKDGDSGKEKGGGGFLSSLFGWKKSKQAVLPDDKNPTVSTVSSFNTRWLSLG